MEKNEGRKQTSRGIRDSHETNSELLEGAETYERNPPRSGESKWEAEFKIQQREGVYWAVFDVDGPEQCLIMPSYPPLLDSPSSKERRSSPIEDEKDSGFLSVSECSKSTGERLF